MARAKSPKIQRLKKKIKSELKKGRKVATQAHKKAESLRWNTLAGAEAIHKAEYLAGGVAVLEELLEWCERENVPDL
jgi:hypothetical protein